MLLTAPPSDLPALIYPTNVPAFHVEQEVDPSVDLEYVINFVEDIYASKFLTKSAFMEPPREYDFYNALEHLNFICCSKEKNQNFFVTVLEDKQSNGYAALVNSRKGFEEVLLRANEVQATKGTSVLKKVHNIICERFQCTAYHVANEALSHDIALVEQKHTQV